MSQVSITAPVNGTAVDGDAMRAILQTLADAINNIDSTQLSPGCVSEEAISSNAVTQDKMADASVGTSELVDYAVSPLKLAKTGFIVGTVSAQHSGFSAAIASTLYSISGASFSLTPTYDCYLVTNYHLAFYRQEAGSFLTIYAAIRNGSTSLASSIPVSCLGEVSQSASASIVVPVALTKDTPYSFNIAASLSVVGQEFLVGVQGYSLIIPR